MNCQGKRIWITGASSGIGAGLARAFGAEGGFVILSGRNSEALSKVAADIPQHKILPFEATDHASLPRIVDEAGPVDMLINNAGISQRGLFEDTSMDVLRTIMEVDFFAPVHLTKLVLPQMLARGSGHILATSSVAGKVGSPQRTAYCSAKHALMGFFDALRTEVGARGVSITTIIPGYVRTEIAARALTADGSPKGPVGDEVDGGISPDEAAAQILAGLAAGKREIRVGGDTREMALLDLKQNDPDGLIDVMDRLGQAVVRKLKG